MVPSNVEERSAIDHENYVVVSEESVVDGVANFMARCVVSNPNAQVCELLCLSFALINALLCVSYYACMDLQKLTPEELQKSMYTVLTSFSV